MNSAKILALIVTACWHVQAALATDAWAPVARLTSPRAAAGNHFGAVVSMSGTRLVVGEPFATNGGNVGAGNVYVYDLIGKNWQLTADIQMQTANFFSVPHGHFGAAVAVSGDRMIVGAPDADCCEPTIPALGFTLFYNRNSSTGQWEAVSGSTNGFDPNAHFGISVAMDEDVAISGRVPDGATTGSATLYRWNGTNDWNYAGEVTPSIGTNGMRFGASVAIMQSTNVPGGALAIIGAPNYSPVGATNAGAAFAFNMQNAVWQAYKTLSDNPPVPNDAFGSAVGLTQNRVVIGAPGRNSPGGTQGLGGVDAFNLVGSNIVLDDNLYTRQQSANARVGASLAITPDPSSPMMVVGSPLGNGASDAGSAFLFKVAHPQAGDQWMQQDRVTLGTDAADNDQFGTSVAIAGKFAAVGVPLREAAPGLTDSGIVEIFTIDTIFTDGFENP